MVSEFDLEQLQDLLKDFYRITGIRITVFDNDLTELVSYPEQCATFCQIIRSTTQGRIACAQCDRQACAIAAKENRTYIYRCHAGLTEAVTPLYIGKVLVGYLFFGHVFCYGSKEEGWLQVACCCEGLNVDMAALKAACGSCRQVSQDYIRSAARILHATASHLVQERMATLQEDSITARLDAYLSVHYTEPVTPQLLCRELGISRSKLYRLSDQMYGCGISQQIRKLRMERARQLLQIHPELSISQIAEDCGYTDYNYFISVFSHTTGQSPGSYRNQVRKKT